MKFCHFGGFSDLSLTEISWLTCDANIGKLLKGAGNLIGWLRLSLLECREIIHSSFT